MCDSVKWCYTGRCFEEVCRSAFVTPSSVERPAPWTTHFRQPRKFDSCPPSGPLDVSRPGILVLQNNPLIDWAIHVITLDQDYGWLCRRGSTESGVHSPLSDVVSLSSPVDSPKPQSWPFLALLRNFTLRAARCGRDRVPSLFPALPSSIRRLLQLD